MPNFTKLSKRLFAHTAGLLLFALFVAMLASAASPAAQDQPGRAQVEKIADGIYVLEHSDESLPLVKRVDGKPARLGRMLSDNCGKAQIVSLQNDNEEYSLRLSEVAGIDGAADSQQMLVVAAGHVMFVSSWGNHQDSDLTQLSTTIPNARIAREVAVALDVPLEVREHPGHQLLTTWTPTEESFRPGQAVNLRLRIENVGDTTVRFYEGGQQRGYRDNQFRFIARAGYGYGPTVPDTGDPRNMGGIAVLRELKPGDVFEKQIKLNEWFKFTEPDTYRITAMYELEFYGEDRGLALWHDFAIGECSVQISAKEAAQ